MLSFNLRVKVLNGSGEGDEVRRRALKKFGFSLPIYVAFFFLLNPQNLLAAPWPLGSLASKTLSRSNCPSGYACEGFEVSCPGIPENATGFLGVSHNLTAPRGLVVFFTGGGGGGWWSDTNQGAENLAIELRNQGFFIVQVSWRDVWWGSSPGLDAGVAHLACRPATVIKYIYDTYYIPLGVRSKKGEAGFCITGNSGGAGQVSYALSHYGLDDILDVVIPTGGPPFAVLAKSCMRNPKQRKYWYPPITLEKIDRAFGFFDGNGPAVRHDPAFITRWKQESVRNGGNDYYHPNTRIQFLIGEEDNKQRAVARDYYRRLRKKGSPYVSWKVVPQTPHLVIGTSAGLDLLKEAILDTIPAPQ